MKLSRTVLALCAPFALSACLWRPPPIPPLSNPNAVDSGRGVFDDASYQSPPDVGAAPPSAECLAAATVNDGSIPERLVVDGSVISCGRLDAGVTSDGAGVTSDGAGGAGGDAAGTTDGAGDSARDEASTASDAGAASDGA